MKNLEMYAKECITELNNIGIYPNKIDKWIVNSRAKSRWGQCSKKNRTYTIQISSCLLTDDAPILGLKATICHELIHAVDDCMNHGDKWNEYANRINKAYGYNISRTNNYKDKGFSENPLKREVKVNYKIQCNSCNRTWNYNRAGKIVVACRKNNAKCPCGKSNFTVFDL